MYVDSDIFSTVLNVFFRAEGKYKLFFSLFYSASASVDGQQRYFCGLASDKYLSVSSGSCVCREGRGQAEASSSEVKYFERILFKKALCQC